ncbi:prepilin-type N-terminal cleavage/methylation domain-containing protein [Candidatus Saccharibacteria bacterium]|nr:prepilin-type N-terminal cleavage/methylation domain-containing protein [Candidatus Saccharibacteria bacterium]
MQSLKKKTEGFTIIEVMIVLVIAAVIILIVFLAVPALQRNSRNNQRKNDAARMSAAVSEFANNASGVLPTTYAEVGSYAGSLGFYTLPSGSLATTDQAAVTNADTIVIARSSSCTGAMGSDDVGTDRQFAVLYAVETSGTPVSQCIQG